MAEINMDLRSHFAWELIKQHGMIQGVEDGEDSTGRSKGRALEPKEIVDKAFAISDCFISQSGTFSQSEEELVERIQARRAMRESLRALQTSRETVAETIITDSNSK